MSYFSPRSRLATSAAVAFALVALVLLSGGAPTSAQATGPIQTVFVIVFENYDWSQIAGSASAPYINGLLTQSSYALKYSTPAGVHPSTPNYWWMEAGQDFGLAGQSGYTPALYPIDSTAHLATLLKNAGISWKTYQEGIGGTACPLTDAYPYVVRHNPFVFFNDVTGNQNPNSSYCISHVRPYTELAGDLAQNTVARYNFIVPNACNDMHDCGIAAGDTWLANNLPAILNSPAYLNGGAVFVTWDEGANATSDGPIGMVVLSPAGKGNGYSNSAYYTHSSLLLTLQEIFGVRPLLGDASNATDLSDLFASFPAVTPSSPTPVNGANGVVTKIMLQWSSSGGHDAVYFGTSSAPPLVASGVATRSYLPATLSPNTTYYWQIVSQTAAGTTPGPVWQFTTGTNGWSDEDIGAVGLAGSATWTTGTVTVKGAGADIWGYADDFQYVYQPLAGDGQIVARVTGLQNTNTYAKAGVMMRGTLSPGSDHVILDMKPGGGVEFMQRAAPGGATAYLGGTTLTFPGWLRLARSGNIITASVSSDGATWSRIGATTTALPPAIFVGLPVTSHTTTALTTATFDNVTLSAAGPSTPGSPAPSNGATGVPANPTLTWSATGATSYDVSFGTTNPPALVVSGLSTASYAPPVLSYGTTYFWQVLARNAYGTTMGSVWSFTTAAAPQPPSAPGSPSPANGATGVPTNVTLTWSATGATSYDVSFGTKNPPALVASGLSTASYGPGTLTANATYYWQVVARNPVGASPGPVWAFVTAASTVVNPNVVIYASDIAATSIHGSWSPTADSTSPNGIALATPDLGWSATSAPLASPTDYVDVTFNAAAGTGYTIWLRLKALNNSKYNDSVWVQFSDARAGGSPVYPLNSTSGLLVNLATDYTASSLFNWGWQNTAYWLTQATTVTFATTGQHTLRIQVREDGIRFDQIVLSPTTYLTSAPGPVGGDSTIVPK